MPTPVTEPMTMPSGSLETVPEPLVETPMCPCGKPMGFQEPEKSWRCLACNPIPTNAPICKTQVCKRPLTWLKETGCWRCLHCNPIKEFTPTEEREHKYIDQKMTPETVQEMIKKEMSGIGDIVRETMAEFNLKETEDPDYPPTRAKINEIAEATGVGGENIHISVKVPKPETWLQKAKRLGVRTHNEGTGGMRKKVDIMADMERLGEETDAQIPEELRTEEQG